MHAHSEVLSPTPISSLVPGPLHLWVTLTTSGQQIIYDDHLLPWFQGVFLYFQLSLWMEASMWSKLL